MKVSLLATDLPASLQLIVAIILSVSHFGPVSVKRHCEILGFHSDDDDTS
jgi:hypothetical protein